MIDRVRRYKRCLCLVLASPSCSGGGWCCLKESLYCSECMMQMQYQDAHKHSQAHTFSFLIFLELLLGSKVLFKSQTVSEGESYSGKCQMLNYVC